jgi:hypothetical protein
VTSTDTNLEDLDYEAEAVAAIRRAQAKAYAGEARHQDLAEAQVWALLNLARQEYHGRDFLGRPWKPHSGY